jgi:hypothetical protein
MAEFTPSDFSEGGRAGQMAPSWELCKALETAAGPGRDYPGMNSDHLTGAISRWQALEARAAAGKLDAIVALLKQRGIPGLGTSPGGLPLAWYDDLVEELAPALGLSRNGTDKLIFLAWHLAARLPRTAAALHAGIIDAFKAQIIAETTAALDDEGAALAEKMIGPELAGKTPGDIRRLAERAAVTVDPAAAEDRRKDAEKHDARVATWREPAGTAAIGILGGNPAQVIAAEQAITARAAAYKKAGMEGTADQLRHRAALDALTGATADGPAGTPGVRASVTLLLWASTLAGRDDKPAELAGWGATDPALARELAAAAAAAGPASDWHITVVNDRGWAVGHGCPLTTPGTNRANSGSIGQPGHPDPVLRLALPGGTTRDFTIAPIPAGTPCDHRYETKGHDPSPLLRHLTQVRDGTCTAPSCRRPATRADYEHTTPFDQGGRTCMCDGDMKCRRDHQIKQDPRWTITTLAPGITQWTTPSGRSYTTTPHQYA